MNGNIEQMIFTHFSKDNAVDIGANRDIAGSNAIALWIAAHPREEECIRVGKILHERLLERFLIIISPGAITETEWNKLFILSGKIFHLFKQQGKRIPAEARDMVQLTFYRQTSFTKLFHAAVEKSSDQMIARFQDSTFDWRAGLEDCLSVLYNASISLPPGLISAGLFGKSTKKTLPEYRQALLTFFST